MSKIKLSHTTKALLITLVIELVIVVLLFRVGLKSRPKEKAYAMEFIDDSFDFDTLQPEEKIELPDISKYINHKSGTNIASNALQEDKVFEDFKQHHENALKEFYDSRNNEQVVTVGVETPKKKIKPKEEKKRYSGESNIKYYIKNRRDMYIANPLYTCPNYMSGIIVIDIVVERSGKVVSAKFNKQKSSTKAACLIDNTVQAALKTYFNNDSTAPELQHGYITYRY